MTWRMPAEWEPQESVWLVWPRDPLTWPDRLEAARATYLEAMRHIAMHQHVDLVVHPDLHESARAAVEAALPESACRRIRIHAVEHQDSWIRDYGPTMVVDDQGGRKGIKWGFDAWGGKYDALRNDIDVPHRLGPQAFGASEFVEAGFVLEGGAIEVDGEGTLLTTEACLLEHTRNPGMTREDFEVAFAKHLGVRKTIWLGDGVEGDDTDGHIDDIARFVAPGHVVCCSAPPDHPDYAVLADNLARLRAATDANGRTLQVTELPMPPRQETEDGETLPASHANFLVTTGVVLVPTFGGASDAVALAALRQAYPDRAVVALDSRDLIWGMGSIHCLSQQVPAART